MDIRIPDYGEAYAIENLDLTSDTADGPTASNLKDSKNRPVKFVLVTVTGNVAHVTMHGVAATGATGTNVGIAVAANSTLLVSGENNIRNLSFINHTAGSDAVVKIHYYS